MQSLCMSLLRADCVRSRTFEPYTGSSDAAAFFRSLDSLTGR